MKKNYIFLTSLLLLTVFSLSLSAQRNEWVNQVIGLNGGKFESSPPFIDFVTVQSYNPVTQVVNVFNTIYTQSVQDVVINGSIAYVAAQDSIVMYNIDTYQRVAAIADSGLSKLFYFKGCVIVSKQYPITQFFVEVLNANDLSLIARIDGISGECAGMTSVGDNVYVAVNGGFLGTNGKVAVIESIGWTLVNEIDFGPEAIGINNLYTYDTYVFSVNKTPYGSADTGSITRYNYGTGAIVNKVLGVKIGEGFGVKDSILYLKINEGMGSYNFKTQLIVDTVIIADPGSALNFTIHSAAIDYVNDLVYLNIGSRQSFGIGIVATLTGDSVTSFQTGINAEALAIDYRTPTGIPSIEKSSFIITPNPADNHITVRINENNVTSIKIYDLTGRLMLTQENVNNENIIDVSTYPSGIYMVTLGTASGNKVRKFIKK